MPPLADNTSGDDYPTMGDSIYGNNLKPNNHRTVHFCGDVRVFKILRISDFSDKEKEATWYNSDEYDLMTRSVRNTRNMIDLMTRAPKYMPNRKYLCNCGVLSTSDFHHRREAISAAVTAVLMEQTIQYNQGHVVEDVLTDVYWTHSRKSRCEAQERAHYYSHNAKLSNMASWTPRS